MDESFKNLNGPTADAIQSDYLAKERRAAEELLALQLGNAKKLADLRSKLLSQLTEEALEEGKAVEDYLAEYGLQRRLEALATELKATQSAQAGQLDELQAAQQATSQKLLAAETKLGQLRSKQLANEAAQRKASLDAYHKAELGAMQERAKLDAQLQSQPGEVVSPDIAIDPIEAQITPQVGEIKLEEQTVEVAPVEVEADIRAKAEDLQGLKTQVSLEPQIGALPEVAVPVTLTPDLTQLENLEVAVKATLLGDTANLSAELAEGAVTVSKAPTEDRASALGTVQDVEASIIAQRSNAEAELLSTRLSSLDAIRVKVLELAQAAGTTLSSVDPSAETMVIAPELNNSKVEEISQRLKEALNLESIVLPGTITPALDEAQVKELIKQLSAALSLEPTVEVEKTVGLLVKSLTQALDSDTAGISANISAGGLSEDAKTQVLKDIADLQAQIDETLRFSVTPESEEAKQAVVKAVAEYEAQTLAAVKKAKGQELQLVTQAFKTQQITTDQLRLQHDSEVAVRHAKALADQAALQLELRKKTLVSTAELQQQHEDAQTAQHLKALIARQNKEIELKQLSLMTEADLQQQYEDDKALRAVDAQTRLEQKKQELALATLAAKDEEYLRNEALAEQEAARLDAQIKAAQDEAARVKQQIKNEENLIAVRLKSAFKGDDAKYGENPAALNTDIAAQVKNGRSVAARDELAAKEESLKQEQAQAEAAAIQEAESSGQVVDEAAIKAKIQREFDIRREQAALEIAEKYSQEDAELERLLGVKQKQEDIINKAKTDARKKADKEEEKQHKKRLGQAAELKDYGKVGQTLDTLSKFNSQATKEKLIAEGMDPDEAAEEAAKAQKESIAAIGDLATTLNQKGVEIAKKQSAIDTRLQGLTTDESKGGIEKKSGSYWKTISDDITKGIGVSRFFKQETVAASVEKLVGQGISFNLEERAFLDTLKDKVATTFNVADGTLLKLVRIQQADTSAARLGMESALTEFLNSMYATTEYMQQAAESVRQNLYEATALMEAKQATEFEYEVQKWLGSLYSVGFSQAEGIASTLGKLTAGDISGITEGNMGNLLVMAANEASIPIAQILEKGLDAKQTNTLMEAMVNYLTKIYNETKGSNVLAQQFADVYGLAASDLKAVANLSSSLQVVAKQSENYGSLLKQVNDMTNSLSDRTSAGEMFDNVKENFMYTLSATMGNNAVLSSLNLTANLLKDLVGGIDLPFLNVWGFGVDLNTTVADLMNVAALSGTVLGGMGKLIAGLSNGVGPSSMLRAFGVDTGSGGPDVVSRGTSATSITTRSGSTESESGFIGNENASDIKEKTVSDAAAPHEKQVAEAKEEQEDKEEARAQMMAGHIVDIYELLQEVTQGAKKFHVQLDIGNNPMSWAGGTWN